MALIGGYYIPNPYVTHAGGGDASTSLVVLGILLLAVVVVAAVYYLVRPRTARKAVVTEPEVRELPKAA